MSTFEKVDWTVLIVEDDQDNMNVAVQVLSFMGAEVHTAANGLEGLEMLRTIDPTFILLDLSMPVMDGWKMLQEIRYVPERAALPVIAVTAHAMENDKERVFEAGFDGYISKPFNIATFVQDIRQCLEEVHNNHRQW